ncbi:hypothetical protein EJ04DRAFT_598831 [Polyplosphaeria fusca]|uniref:Uncharacterized protein n=1 Tax=Polyplosphaeria fusca TaxID=682080 RepID=A0A9P4V183_9PLEO|nr:hypothetical protein EJ04DRAFT_598831 [Polyplosphaeria fusca]
MAVLLDLSRLLVALAAILTLTDAFGRITTRICDGTHGVFFCTLEEERCFFAQNGAFGCAQSSPYTATSSCIASGTAGKGKTCRNEDNGCTSCSDSDKAYCITVTNPAMGQYSIDCATNGGTRITSYTYDTKSVSSSSQPAPSTLVGAPLPAATPSSILPISTASATSDWVSSSPSSTPQRPILGAYDNGSLSTGARVGTGIGAIAGAVIFTILAFFLFKWYKDREMNRMTSGTLPAPRKKAGGWRLRRSSNNDPRIVADNRNNLDYDEPTPNLIPELTGGEIMEMGGHGPVASRPPPYEGTRTYHLLAMPYLTHPDKSCAHRLATTVHHTQSPPHSYESPKPAPTIPSPAELEAASNRHSTLAPMPVEFPTHSARCISRLPTGTSYETFIAADSPSLEKKGTSTLGVKSSMGGLHVSEVEEERKRKSSMMLPIAGPYLTAERALGEGYWRAEKEQLEADRAMRAGKDDNTKEQKEGGK